MTEHKLIIRPKTKVGELLDVYPELEDVLIKLVPAFKKLKNPILRKTVARVTTLQQASVVGKVKLEELLVPLRIAVGQTEDVISEEEKHYFNDKPEWYNEANIIKTIDAAKLIDENKNPLGIITKAIAELEGDNILKIIQDFIPAPIIDDLKTNKNDYWLTQVENKCHLFIKKC